ncbi:hypothetical protein H671_21436 [Cricetulus griseus]|nr:hypothetical protein H671_21436 [Cricetulus griseus]
MGKVFHKAPGFCYTMDAGTPLGYPAVALCHGDPEALGQQDPPLHVQIKQMVESGYSICSRMNGGPCCSSYPRVNKETFVLAFGTRITVA